MAVEIEQGLIRDPEEAGDDPPQHGLPSNNMALITSEHGIMCSLGIKWP